MRLRLEQIHNKCRVPWVLPDEHLVEEHQARVMTQNRNQVEPPFLAVAQAVRVYVAIGQQAALIEQGRSPHLRRRVEQVEVTQSKGGLGPHAIGEQLMIGILEHEARLPGQLRHRRVIRIAAQYRHLSRWRVQQPQQTTQQSGLAGAVVAHHGHELTGL